jgi:hypothetical protein
MFTYTYKEKNMAMSSAISGESEFQTGFNIVPGEHLNHITLNRNENRLKKEINTLNYYRQFQIFGHSADIPAWVAGTVDDIYEKDTLVKYSGLVYYCVANANGTVIPGTNKSKWKVMVNDNPKRLDMMFDTFDISNMDYNASGLLTVATYVGGYVAKLYYNASNLLNLVEYYNTDGTTILATNTLVYDSSLQLKTATWAKLY